MTDPITIDDFLTVDIRVGTVVAVADYPEAREPAWKLTIDSVPSWASANRAHS